MFETKIDIKTLRDLIDSIRAITDEATLIIGADKVTVKAPDAAHISMCMVELSKNAFKEYKASESELAIDLDKLHDALQPAGPEDEVYLTHDEKAHQLIVQFGNITRKMSLLSPEPPARIPTLTPKTKLTLKTDLFKTGIRAANKVSTEIILKADKENFFMGAEEELDGVELKLPKSLLTSLECPEPTVSKFPLDFLTRLSHPICSETMAVFLGTNYPLLIEFKIGENGTVKYMLAPRVDGE